MAGSSSTSPPLLALALHAFLVFVLLLLTMAAGYYLLRHAQAVRDSPKRCGRWVPPPPMLMAGASFAAGPVCCVVCGPTCPGRNRAAPMRAVAPDGSAAPPFHPKACSCRSKRKAQGKIQFKPRVKHVGPVTRSESAQTGG